MAEILLGFLFCILGAICLFLIFVLGAVVIHIAKKLYYDHLNLVASIRNEVQPRDDLDFFDHTIIEKAMNLAFRIILFPIAVIPIGLKWLYLAYVKYRYKVAILTNPDPRIRSMIERKK